MTTPTVIVVLYCSLRKLWQTCKVLCAWVLCRESMVSAHLAAQTSHLLFHAHLNPSWNYLGSGFCIHVYLLLLHCITCIHCSFISLPLPSPSYIPAPWVLGFVPNFSLKKWSWFPSP